MTTLRSIELDCPVCHDRFESQAVVSSDTSGGRRTDFHAQARGLQPLPYLIHTCPRCGYTGREDRFSEYAILPLPVAEHVLREFAPLAAMGELVGSEKYEFAAKLAEWQVTGPRERGDLWLRAAWCAADEDDVEAERFYRRHAAWAFDEALSLYDEIPRDDRAAFTYLVGELWRRIGDAGRATEWFDRVADEITSPAEQQWALIAARQQRDEPREWFTHAPNDSGLYRGA